MSVIRVIKPGLQTTVQDLGRWGWQAMGVPVAGPMDPCSHRIANALVGNAMDAATLEIAIVGPVIEFEDDRRVAVAGADFAITMNGAFVESVPARTMWHVAAGAQLRFGEKRRGARAYLAIEGGIETPLLLGSRSTHLVSRIGGLEGRALVAGDRLPLGKCRPGPSRPPEPWRRRFGPGSTGLPAEAFAKAGGSQRTRPTDRADPAVDTVTAIGSGAGLVRVLPGPQIDWFERGALHTLQSQPYRVTTASNRMGFHLEGPAVAAVRAGDMISDTTPLGALQVPGSGEPILLMADRQTTGGYPQIATVIGADIGIAGQLAPGDTISFRVCSIEEAWEARRRQEQALQEIERQTPS